MPTKNDFIETYRGGKRKEEYNRAIRAEMAGGDNTLDLLRKVNFFRNKMRLRGSTTETRKLLAEIETDLNEIRDDMVDEIQRRYNLFLDAGAERTK